MFRHRGFTLVELLVVVGIIAILTAILLPVMSSARRQARTVVCLSHIRQLAAGFQLYLSDNGGRWRRPVYQWGHHDYGPFPIEDKLFPHRRRGQQSEIMYCPEATEPGTRGFTDPYYPTYYGGVFRAWGFPDTSTPGEWVAAPVRGSSYGMNGWIANPNPGSESLPIQERLCITLPARDSSRIPLLADSKFVMPRPMPTDRPPLRLNPHSPNATSYHLSTSVCIARHGRAVNVAFLDGHARTVPLAELWKLKWNNDWTDTDVTLPPE